LVLKAAKVIKKYDKSAKLYIINKAASKDARSPVNIKQRIKEIYEKVIIIEQNNQH